MTQEEKAKAYDRVCKEIKDFFEGKQKMYSNVNQTLEYLFPELKESEDEKIRKALIDGFTVMKESKNCGKTFSNHNIPVVDILAWLEKQGEKPQSKTALEAIHEEKVDNANKVEPKFHEGEWIIDGQGIVRQIERVIENVTNHTFGYDLVGGDYFNEEYDVRLWTIADAKDGDVLCCESGWTCIFKALDSDNKRFSSYCFMDSTGWFCEKGSESHTLEDAYIKACHGNTYPATKEQRDLLFAKMKEAGYEWNNGKKELKKIKKASKWTKEDEENFRDIIGAIHTVAYQTTEDEEARIDWIKSLKQKNNKITL